MCGNWYLLHLPISPTYLGIAACRRWIHIHPPPSHEYTLVSRIPLLFLLLLLLSRPLNRWTAVLGRAIRASEARRGSIGGLAPAPTSVGARPARCLLLSRSSSLVLFLLPAECRRLVQYSLELPTYRVRESMRRGEKHRLEEGRVEMGEQRAASLLSRSSIKAVISHPSAPLLMLCLHLPFPSSRRPPPPAPT